MNGSHDAGLLIGRILLVVIFVLSGFSKITNFAGTEGFMATGGIPQNLVLPGLILTILIELGGGLLVVVGFQTRLVALLIFLYLIPVTILFHYIPYREATAHGQTMVALGNMINLMKNISTMGGLIVLASAGPGRYSIDGRGEVSSVTGTRHAA
jgi:putative oxidoreductase